MAGKIKDRTGQRQGKLTFLKISGRDKNGLVWLAECDCGTQKEINTNSIKSQSCGCLSKIGHHKTHGQSGKNPTYRAWTSMRNRCDNPKNKNYKDYGGRGIKYCKRWDNYELFLKDLGSKPEKKSLDRIDVDGNYCLKNCRWSTSQTQQNNTRSNVYFTYLGEKKSKSEWTRKLNIHKKVFEYWVFKIGFEETCRLGLENKLPKKKIHLLNFNGKEQSLTYVASMLNTDRKTLRKLLEKYSLDQISSNIDLYRTKKKVLPTYLEGVSRKSHEYNSIYLLWHEIKAWCYNKNHRNYKYYGKKGVQMDPLWLDDLDNFIKDVGKKPEDHILRLINEKGNFDRKNVHWVESSIPISKNPNLDRSTKYFQHNGIKDSKRGWAKRLGVPPRQLDYYLESRGSFKKAYEVLTSNTHKKKSPVFYSYKGEERSVSNWATYLCIPEKKFRKLLEKSKFEDIIKRLKEEKGNREADLKKFTLKGYSSKGNELYSTYLSWTKMRERCQKKEHKDYPNYGGRGIKVCKQWENFETFYNRVRPDIRTFELKLSPSLLKSLSIFLCSCSGKISAVQ